MASSEQPAVSIVMPVYNVERYLEEALDSVRRQTLCDIEAVCVDDGSEDGSLAVLERAAREDARIRVFSQPNAGVSAARNAALDRARGRAVMFLDGDDRLRPDACERALAALEGAGADILTFGARCFPEGVAPQRLVECLSPRDAVYDACCDELLFEERSRPYMWRSAFSRAFLEKEGIRFPEGLPVGEDQVLYFRAYPRSARTVLASDKLYEYRAARDDSAMGAAREDDAARVADHVRVAELIAQDWAENGWFERFGWRTLGWLLEFVALDLNGLEDGRRALLKSRFGAALRAALGETPVEALPFGRATRAVLLDMLGAADSPPLGKMLLYRFYVERRGLRACVERAVSAARGRE